MPSPTPGAGTPESVGRATFPPVGSCCPARALNAFRSAYRAHHADALCPFDPLQLVRSLGNVPDSAPAQDKRIRAAIGYVASHLDTPPRVTDIAEHVGLSESRLRHLFVRETGIPLTHYVLWSRMKVALHALVAGGLTITEAAHEAGYADHAHFTRTFRRMFGVRPSLVLRNSEFLEVFDS